jgi:hypothetical protein
MITKKQKQLKCSSVGKRWPKLTYLFRTIRISFNSAIKGSNVGEFQILPSNNTMEKCRDEY